MYFFVGECIRCIGVCGVGWLMDITGRGNHLLLDQKCLEVARPVGRGTRREHRSMAATAFKMTEFDAEACRWTTTGAVVDRHQRRRRRERVDVVSRRRRSDRARRGSGSVWIAQSTQMEWVTRSSSPQVCASPSVPGGASQNVPTNSCCISLSAVSAPYGCPATVDDGGPCVFVEEIGVTRLVNEDAIPGTG